ncbi:MAG: tetratricopeptide repeat protein [Candidatus Aminicenantia bacterium]
MKKKNQFSQLLTLIVILFGLFNYLQGEEIATSLQKSSKAVISVISYDTNNKEINRGKGVIISEDGLVLTNYHLLIKAKSAKVELVERKEWKKVDWVNVFHPSYVRTEKEKKKRVKKRDFQVAGVIGINREFNLAVLKLKEGKKKLPVAPLSLTDEMNIGDKVIFVVDEETVSEGAITNVRNFTSQTKIFQTNLSIFKEMSGNPIFDSQGKVIGIAIYILENLNLVIPASYASKLVGEQKAKALSKITEDDFFTTSEGFYLKGIAHIIGEQRLEAIQCFEKTISLKPENSDAYFQLGFLYSRAGENEKALNAYQEASKLNPSNYKAYFGLGMVYLKLNQYEKAIPPLAQCTKINPEFPDAYYNLALSYEQTGRYETAAEIYQKFIEVNPGPAWTGYNRLGEVYLKLKQYNKAVLAFQEVIKTNPSDTRVNYNLAYAYDMAGQYEKAVETYQNLIKLNPKETDKYYNLIFRVYDKAGEYQKAIEVGQQMIQQNPDKAGNYYNLGIEYFKLKDYQKALEIFNQTTALDPNYGPAYYNIGLIHFKLAQFEEAIQAFNKFLELQPDNPDGYYNLGAAYLQLKQYEAALKPLQRAAELNPNFTLAHYNLAITYFVLKDRFSANEQYKILRTLDPVLAEKLRKIIFK